MPIEAALIKPVVDALMGLFRQGEHIKLKHNAEAALREAIRELLLADPNESEAEAKIAIAKAAGLISEDVLLADDMLRKVRAKKSTVSRVSRKRATETPAKESARKTAKKNDAGDPGAKK